MQLFVLTATVLCCTFITAEAADVPVIHYIPSFDFDGNLVTTDATVKTEHLEGGRWIPRNLTVLEVCRTSSSPFSLKKKFFFFHEKFPFKQIFNKVVSRHSLGRHDVSAEHHDGRLLGLQR